MTATNAPRRRRRVRWPTILGILALALTALCVAGVFIARTILVGRDSAAPGVITQVVPVEQGDLTEIVQVNGALEPRDRASVAFSAGVRVRELLVQEGEQVAAGQVLARLETRDLELKVASARAEVDLAQRALDKLEAGPSEAELAQAAASTARARADLAAAAGEVRPVDVDVARARRDEARQRLDDLKAGLAPDDLTAAEKALLAAQDALRASQDDLERTRDSASRAKTDAQQSLERGAKDLIRAQRAYSDAYWDWDYVQHTGRHPRDTITNPDTGVVTHRELDAAEIDQFERTLEDVADALKESEQSLKRLQEAYDQAREDEISQIQSAERQVDAAGRDLDESQRLLDTARTKGVAAAILDARKELADAEKAYADLVDNPQRPAQRAALQAALLEAIAAEEKLKDGPDPIELSQAKTTLERARAGLAAAEAELAEAELRAPIAGTVVDITLKEGTLTESSDAISIADLSGFLIRGQVTEQSVAQLSAGQAVQVSVDALPDVSFRGELARVSELPDSQGQADQGFDPFGGGGGGGALGGLYPVEITFDAEDERLRVGMATTASIEILNIPDTLIIPLQAVEDGPDGPTVRRASGAAGPDGQPIGEPVPVQLGAISGDRVQVLGGLAPGDQVILPQIVIDGGGPQMFQP
ncbi:HlyD family efflux transporter periplasmic adaptor subunit [Oscillochloris sp. ZM17-4]|uniref:HlyD family efflux transporter periplasmic adaptor subunit n=1 Tax=Oscillochloris sp. ZM17-4 TaxID=2866714 RepID=UPI001C73280C|nr:HlyD family efflux transporter periplasmic adaptor subunit [Oscillochloris sp. ZM17-4]MBX0329534.1 HlyD family efflux transporter periplasmic adaptor subunit [Oscillochloris sp. ZM17-4]